MKGLGCVARRIFTQLSRHGVCRIQIVRHCSDSLIRLSRCGDWVTTKAGGETVEREIATATGLGRKIESTGAITVEKLFRNSLPEISHHRSITAPCCSRSSGSVYLTAPTRLPRSTCEIYS